MDQRQLTDGDPFTGDWTRFHSWYTLLCNVLETASPEWAEILERLHKFPAATIKDEDLTSIIGKVDPLAHTAYQNELFRVFKGRVKGTLRDALVARQPKRAFDTLKQWLRMGQDRSIFLGGRGKVKSKVFHVV